MSVNGFSYPFRGLRFLLNHPRLLSFIAVPIGINTLLYSLFGWFVYSRFGDWVEAVVPKGDAWYWAVSYYILALLAGMALILFVFYTFTLAGNLILAPFNELLSEKVETIYSGSLDREAPFSISLFLKDMMRSYRAEAGRLILYFAGFISLLALNMVPVAGTILYGLFAALYSIFFLCWEFLDYPMERRRFTFGMKRQLAFENIFIFISFGAGAGLLLIIPLVNLAAIPVCVTGATLLFSDMKNGGRFPDDFESGS